VGAVHRVETRIEGRWSIGGIVSVLLCLPTILGAVVFLLLKLWAMPGAPAPMWSLRLAEVVIGSVIVEWFVAAAYGPLLLVPAGWLAARLLRSRGSRSLETRVSFASVILGLLMAAVFYSFLISDAPVP
jgi:hypothetical protein